MMPGLCIVPVSATLEEEGIIHNIAEKYSDKDVVNASNLATFVIYGGIMNHASVIMW